MGRGNGLKVKYRNALKRRSSSKVTPGRVQVSIASSQDIDKLVALKTEVVRKAFGELYSDSLVEKYIKKNCTADHFRYRIGRSGYYVFKAEDEQGNILGVATLRPRGSRADSGGSGLYVSERGQGVGSKLLKEREDLARKLGCDSARVTVFRTNTKAQDFVQKKGYKKSKGGFREPVFDVRVDYYSKKL